MQDFLQLQYGLVQASRAVLLQYTATMQQQHFTRSSPAFGRGSVRNLLVHICDTYHYWIADRVLQLEPAFPPFDAYDTLDQCRDYFEKTDQLMTLFLERFAGQYTNPLPVQRQQGIDMLSPLTLFTHVITHEFHHKGQILSLSRDLGYTPVDTDVIR
ncbi:DinB family protein [Taibaiella chishuiensis]|uniref:DinB family protein n=1 Tax=Taibaiella chishuiensis TaxID=1434707 RepID=A0A2P8D870_9BACT|nr:DinB family protein [Taibaiella chishuiensis]PSK93403.1 DinB family protein [Taibaiella chishuiensis]